ncbi:MAG: hypothetical protein OTI34_17585, partial [Lewinella sp.]|nr:hypothetical protein [Lewinella sp.]
MKPPFWPMIFLSVALIILSLPLSGQQGLGWTTDPHAGISAAFLQPAATSTTPYNWDLTLGAVGANVRNNFVVLQDVSGYSILNQLNTAQVVAFSETEFSMSVDGRRFFY